MSFFDRLRPRWKHADPTVRRTAVRELTDTALLVSIATEDVDEGVRQSAIETLNDQAALEQIALSQGAMATAAAARITEPSALARLACSASLVAVRHHAVGRLEDRELLNRIGSLDPDATVRALARSRSAGDETIVHLRRVLETLAVAEGKAAVVADFCGSLDDVCRALSRDARFHINGVVAHEETADAATVADVTRAPWAEAKLSSNRVSARFLAQTRAKSESASGEASVQRFFTIKVWRTGEDRFDAVAEEKRMAAQSDAEVWSRASSGGPSAPVTIGQAAVKE